MIQEVYISYSKAHESETSVLQSRVMRLAKAWNRNARNIKGVLHVHGSACMIGVLIGVLTSWINHE